uniref:Uncharacterized protein n=1 Tax=Timema poppense TaxID=170557 RepID=A0A7R9H3K5_TIMPO|nr:unnamed protein product [Timema poppensis]
MSEIVSHVHHNVKTRTQVLTHSAPLLDCLLSHLSGLALHSARWNVPHPFAMRGGPSLLVSQTSRDQLTFLLSEQNSTNRSSVVSPVNERPPLAKVWGFGLLAVGIISLSGLFGGIFLPFLDTKFYSTLMRLLLGLAAGSLTATSTLQLIPEAFRLMDYIDNYIDTSLCMLGSVWALYLFEVFFRIMLHDNKADIVEKVESDGSRTVKNETQLEEEGLLKTTVADNTNSTSKSAIMQKSFVQPMSYYVVHKFLGWLSVFVPQTFLYTWKHVEGPLTMFTPYPVVLPLFLQASPNPLLTSSL